MGSAAKKIDDSLIQQTLREFSILKGLPDRLLSQLAEASEVLDVPAHVQILQQGQVNDHLYFLIDGQVGVYVDGGRVSKLERKGDLLGEMSVISNQPTGATILSETAVTLLRVDSRLFLQMEGPDRDYFLSILYHIYATVLAEKLHVTNQKAKSFEKLNLQLVATQAQLEEANLTLEKKVEERTAKLEQRKDELFASNTKMEELLNNKHMMFNKLNEFQLKHLAPLKDCLDQLRKANPSEPVINESRRVVFDVQQLLGPLVEQYATELAMKSKRVLLAETNPKQQIIAKMALGGTGVELDMVAKLEDGLAKIASQDYDLVFVDTKMLELANQAKLKNPQIGLVLMTSDQIPTYLPALKMLNATPHIVSRDEADRTFTIKNIMTTVTKLISQDFFGMEKYMSWGVDIQSTSIFSSVQRTELVQTVNSYFEKLGIRRANRDRIQAVLEEMLMNAIYDAPTSAEGVPLYNHLPRSAEITLKAEEQGLLRFATDGVLVAVSVQDPFGGLTGSNILRYLENNYAGNTTNLQAPEKKGGAGRGLHQIVENSDLVVFNVELGKKTEVIALFNVEVKERASQNPSFHLFTK